MAYTFTRTGAQIEEIHNTVDNIYNTLGNSNLLSNHNFLTPSPDDSQPAPSATPTSYPPGFQIFSGVFANETTGISNLTYIDGRVSFSGGDLYFAVSNTGGLERLNADQFVASVADFDGKPRTRGVSFALVGGEYRVTVGVDALEDAGATLTPLGSVKLEQGSVATGHEVTIGNKTKTFSSIFTDTSYTELVVSGVNVGDTVVCEDYAPGSGSGMLFFKVVPPTGAADGGKYIDLPYGGLQLEQNLQVPVTIKAFGVSWANLSSNTERLQNCVNYCFANDVSLYGCRDALTMQGQVYIPQHKGGFAGLDSIMTLDFGGARFLPPTGGTVLESGELVGGVWVSTIEKPTGYKNSFNLEITNFSVVGGDFGVRFNNLHHGCKLHKISSNNCNTIADLNHCFYLITDRVTSFSQQPEPWTDERFIIRGDSNLMSLTNCVAINSDIGYKFDNPAGFAAITFENNSVEGVNVGIEMGGIVNSLGVKDCYFENVTDVCMKFTEGVRSTIIENNYFNINGRPTAYIFETAANGGAILFDSSNETLGHAEERLFKDSATVIGTSTIDRGNGQANTLDDLVVDSADYPRNVVLDGFLNIGIDEAVAKRNRGIIPSSYSGRTTKGYTNANNYGFSLISSTATTAAIETRIEYQDREVLIFAFRTNEDGVFVKRIGFIIDNAYWKFSGAGLTIDPDVTISSDSNGYVQINLSNLNNFTALIGGELRVI